MALNFDLCFHFDSAFVSCKRELKTVCIVTLINLSFKVLGRLLTRLSYCWSQSEQLRIKLFTPTFLNFDFNYAFKFFSNDKALFFKM